MLKHMITNNTKMKKKKKKIKAVLITYVQILDR